MVRNDVIITSLPKTMAKIISAKPSKIYITQKVLIRAIQNCTFIEFKSLCQSYIGERPNCKKALRFRV